MGLYLHNHACIFIFPRRTGLDLVKKPLKYEQELVNSPTLSQFPKTQVTSDHGHCPTQRCGLLRSKRINRDSPYPRSPNCVLTEGAEPRPHLRRRNSTNALRPPTTINPLTNPRNTRPILEINPQLQTRTSSPINNRNFTTWNTRLIESAIVPVAAVVAFFEDAVGRGAVVDTKRNAAAASIEAGNCQ
jgi:hypothetical protein